MILRIHLLSSDYLPKTPHPSCYVIHETGITASLAPTAVNADHGLLFIYDGWLTLEQRYSARSVPGSVTVVPAGVPHRPLAGENIDYWLLGFSASSFSFDETQAVMQPFFEVRLGATPIILLSSQAQEKIQTWLKLLEQEAEIQTPESNEVQCSLITLILAEVARAIPIEKEDVSKSNLVAKALRYIQQYSLTPISLSDVAKAVSRTSPHVAAAVKSETGFTVGTWITSSRIAKAAQLLQHTDKAIDQIAPLIGWQDTTHFIRQFRKIYGVTPAVWRKNIRS